MYQSSAVQEDLAAVLVADEAVTFMGIVPRDGARAPGDEPPEGPASRAEKRPLWLGVRLGPHPLFVGSEQERDTAAPTGQDLVYDGGTPSSRASAAGAWRRLKLIRWRAGSTLNTRSVSSSPSVTMLGGSPKSPSASSER